MSTIPDQSETTNKVNQESSDSPENFIASIKVRLTNPSKPDRVALLANILSEHNLWLQEKHEFTSEESRKIFEEIFFGIFVSWMGKNFKFDYQGNICFVGIDEKTSLIVLPPFDKSTLYISPYGDCVSIYQDNVFSSLKTDSPEFCPICQVKRVMLANLTQLATHAKTLELVKKINTDHTKCETESLAEIIQKVSELIVNNPVLGLVTGGYGFKLNCPKAVVKDIMEKYFSEISSLSDISNILDDLFMACILLRVTDVFHFNNCVTNHEIRMASGIGYSTELDGVAYTAEKNQVYAFELTSLFDTAFHKSWEDTKMLQFPKHFNSKVRTFNKMNYDSENFDIDLLFVYIHLKDLDNNMRKSLEYACVKYNPNFKMISLNDDFNKLKLMLKREEFSNGKIYKAFRNSFNRFDKNLTNINRFK